MSRSEKKNEDENQSPFYNLDKGAVMQEMRIFSAKKLKSKQCYILLTKMLYLINTKGSNLTSDEATNVFIAVTKLFQTRDVALRRMMYLLLKELIPIAEDTIIAYAILIKDVNSSVDAYRANAIRVISGIIDRNLIGQLNRFLKQAIVHRDPAVASSALVSGMHLAQQSLDTIKRWSSEVQDAVGSSNVMVQYHALGLLHQIKKHDRLAVSKLIKSLSRSGSVRSHFAQCLLIRFSVEVLQESRTIDENILDYIQGCVSHTNEMVSLEAARALCKLCRGGLQIRLSPAISNLQIFLSSPNPTVKFAAARTLNQLANFEPETIASICSYELELLIQDPNKSIATMCITTLLKVEDEKHIERPLKEIAGFVKGIGDEYKMVVIEALKVLSLKYPGKYIAIIDLLSDLLRDDGGLEYKKSIIETILLVLNTVPEAKESGLENLCEYIEDCEFPPLTVRILHLLGNEGPTSLNPSKYIRYIYNRIILEDSTVRASAVSALAKFGMDAPDLKPKILSLLERSINDPDDEVRDRVTYYRYILGEEIEREFISPQVKDISYLNTLEQSLQDYLEGDTELPFDLSDVKYVPPVEKVKSETPIVKAEEIVASVPEFEHLGPILSSSKLVELTESETEYVVSCVKHIYQNHLVFQFTCENTLEEQHLLNVRVSMEASNKDWVIETEIPAESIAYQETKYIYVCVKIPETGTLFQTNTFWNVLLFDVVDVDPEFEPDFDDAYPDEYQIEGISVNTGDYIKGKLFNDFHDKWDLLEVEGSEFKATFVLSSVNTIEDAVKEITTILGLRANLDSDKLSHPKKHILYLGGSYVEVDIVGRVRMKLTGSGVGVELVIRSSVDEICQLLGSTFYTQ
eukprot:TRINITY_DN12152_c0_g1_i1.p1 TRINITY_DN12152_c0_g1~~TRINITY_DN12152_c0_g1_i1.p1  ORF type:complete len:860 (+),score=186.03 TRINITY_DN12152_c0_g1_i1:42-2621(+)